PRRTATAHDSGPPIGERPSIGRSLASAPGRACRTAGILTRRMANDTINDPRLEEGVWTTDPESGELVPDYESTFPTIEEGQVVNGTVVRVDKDEVLVDIGYKSEGVIPVSELSIRRSINPEDEAAVGDD